MDKINDDDPGSYIAAAIQGIERLFGVAVTIHDHHALLFDAEGRPFLPKHEYHFHPYCWDGRYVHAEWDRNCLAECAFRVESMSLHRLRPFVHHCWKGVTELVVPVVRHRAPVLILYAGPFRGPAAPPARYRERHAALPEPDPERLADLARLLTLAGQGMLRALEASRDTERNAPPSRKETIRRFLDQHAHEPVTLGDLARTLNISASHASHRVKVLFGVPFQELLLAERMTRARNLLLSTDYPLKEIARGCGFKTVYYFGRMFRRFYDCAPGAYRAAKGQRPETGRRPRGGGDRRV